MNASTEFLTKFEDRNPIFAKEVRRTFESNQVLYSELAEPMLKWAEVALGPDYINIMIDGYCEFVVDVNRSQARYEQSGHYQYSSYQEVYEATYNQPEFMNLYHWGVYTTTFVWLHHLELYRLYRDDFLKKLLPGENAQLSLLDLGCGSGIWHFLAHHLIDSINTTAIDISETSVALTKKMAATVFADKSTQYAVADAITWKTDSLFDAGVSCFLLEHLEDPLGLLKNLANAIKPGGLAFVTCALTAAEIDHIYEFKRESEVISLVEEAGFRVIKIHSSSPATAPAGRQYLPRSMALVLQRRHNDIW